MKNKRILPILFTLLLPILGVVTLFPTAVSAELSSSEKDACYNEWNGDWDLTGTKNDTFDASKCNSANGGSCTGVRADEMLQVKCQRDGDDPFVGGNPGTVECDDSGDCADKTYFKWCGRNEAVGVNCLFNDIITFLSVGVGIAVVIGIIIGGITYSTSQGNPAQAQKGMTIIANSAIGLVLYMLMWAIVQWLIPGGVF